MRRSVTWLTCVERSDAPHARGEILKFGVTCGTVEPNETALTHAQVEEWSSPRQRRMNVTSEIRELNDGELEVVAGARGTELMAAIMTFGDKQLVITATPNSHDSRWRDTPPSGPTMGPG